MIDTLTSTPFFGLGVTLLCWYLAVRFQKRTGLLICNPVLVASLLVIGIMLLFHIPLDNYNAGGMLQQQPVARDLRQISAALKMITDMERIGDQAEDIAEIIQFLAGRSAENDDLLREMALSTIHMVTESVDAYVQRDTMLAETVIAEDDVVDNAFDEVKRRLIDKIAAHPDDGEYALDLLMIAKYFERIGDHATNIAEWVIFSVTGVHKEG